MKSNFVSQQLLESRKLFEETVKNADVAYKKGDLESTVAWAKIAAHFAFIRHPGFYTSAKLENLLLSVAQKIENESFSANPNSAFKLKDYGKMRFLHVITESYNSGGHSPFIARWIKNTAGNSVHSLIATSNIGELPEILTTSILESGGWYGSLSELSPSLVDRAVFLRKIARNWADVIVLFVHPFDPLPIVAFGIDGGPPVMFCNHADHAFWLGGSIIDVAVDFHPSGRELSVNRRGKFPSRILPIPLPSSNRTVRNVNVRKQLGLGEVDVMLLTVGRPEKYFAFENFNFLNVMVNVLKKHPNAKLFAVGPSDEGEWATASSLVDGRIKALGVTDRAVLETYYAAADLYVESFPCGSITAMLEAGIHYLPMVGLHINELPHISGEDDVAFKNLPVHTFSIDEFTRSLEHMIADCSSYSTKAKIVKENIEREHCFPGWNSYLDDALQTLPSQHHVRKPQEVEAPPDYADSYMSYLGSKMLSDELMEHSFSRLIRVYSQNVPKSSALKMQAKCLVKALPKVDDVRRGKEYFYSLREFISFAFN